MKENKAIYPVEAWDITEEEFRMEHVYRNETTFALSNGYIGTRGTFEEGYPFSEDEGLEGNFINGFYESEEIRYGEWNYGFPTKSQTLLNLPNGKTVKLFLGEEEFDMRSGNLRKSRRTLHMKEGVLEREAEWESPSGKRVEIRTKRLVSFVNKNLMAMEYEVTPLNFTGEIRLVSVLDGEVENHTRKTNPLVDYGPFGEHLLMEKIEAADIPGIGFVDTTNRNYPTTPYSSNLVGFAAFDEDEQAIQGKMGLELSMEEYLSGTDGRMKYQQAVDGTILPGTTQVYQEAIDGKNVYLTIDSNLQSIVEAQLAKTMQDNNAQAAWALVMEPETGKVLAWGSYPTYDQNTHQEIPSFLDNVADKNVEVGSVMKPFTYAVAIDTGVYNGETTFRAGTFTYTQDPSTGKIIRVPNGTQTDFKPISDALGNDFGEITFDKGLWVSSNVGICELLANMSSIWTGSGSSRPRRFPLSPKPRGSKTWTPLPTISPRDSDRGRPSACCSCARPIRRFSMTAK